MRNKRKMKILIETNERKEKTIKTNEMVMFFHLLLSIIIQKGWWVNDNDRSRKV